MKIFLIYPLDERYHRQTCPGLSLAYLAASLCNNGHKVKLLDRNLLQRKNRFNLHRLDHHVTNELTAFQPDLLVFSSAISLIRDITHFSNIIKTGVPSVKIIIANPYPFDFYSFDPEYNLKNCRNIDIAIHGEGEQTILKVANNLDNLISVGGITFRNKDKIVSTGKAERTINLDDIPLPRRDLLDMKFYCAAGFDTGLYGRGTTIFSSRGCYHNCNYCLSYRLGPTLKETARFHSPERVIQEIENILSLCEIDYLYFYDDDFLANKNRVIELSKSLIKTKINKKIKWLAQTRAEQSRIDEQLLRLMKKAGCIQLEFGFESGSQEELNRMNKEARVEEYLAVAKLMKKTGLRLQGDFLMGYPGQTVTDFEKTLAFIKEIKPTYITSLQYMHLPGTQIYETLKNKHSLRQLGDLGQNHNFTAMSEEKYKEIRYKRMTPLKIKSNRKNFILYHFRRKPFLLFYLILKYVLGHLSLALGNAVDHQTYSYGK